MTDPIADLLTRIRNANKMHHEKVSIPSSTLKLNILKVLKEEGFIADYVVIEDKKQNVIEVTLKYNNNEAVIKGLRRISKPGLRKYTDVENLPKVLHGLGIAIISTSKGVMTDSEARKQQVGGEVLAYIW
jgi:small subunit ribosomal protein S8